MTCRQASLGMQIPPGLAAPRRRARNIDAVAHQVAVALLDHVAEMDAEAKFDALALPADLHARSTHRSLDFNGVVHLRLTTLRNSTIEPSPVRLTMRP